MPVKALDQWAYANGVALKLIQPGKPTPNAYIASFASRNQLTNRR
jgi:putative transposase